MIYEKKSVNLVNSDQTKWKELTPLYFQMTPLYLNLHQHIFYGGSCHSMCNLSNDVISTLSIMNANVYDRFENVCNDRLDSYVLSFYVYQNQLYFVNLFSFLMFQKNLFIQEEIIRKYHLQTPIYIPSYEEIDHDYANRWFEKMGAKYKEIKYISYHLTPQEFWKYTLDVKKSDYRLFVNPNDVSGSDMRWAINYNANLFLDLKYPWGTKGVYNKQAMNLINSIYETKLEIFQWFYQLSKIVKNWQVFVHDLLVEFHVWQTFESWIKEQEYDLENFFSLPANLTKIYYDSMFLRMAKDVLVQFVGFSKIESQRRKTITTTDFNIYDTFWNAFLQGYEIVQLPKLIFDGEKQKLRWLSPQDFITTSFNRECEEELKRIKKFVPSDQWEQFMRKEEDYGN